jgi:hypothetical protein
MRRRNYHQRGENDPEAQHESACGFDQPAVWWTGTRACRQVRCVPVLAVCQQNALVQNRLRRRYLRKELATSALARKNGLVHFRFGDDREFLNIANQPLEVIGLRGLARVVKQINGSCQYGPHFSKHAKCLMGALG